MARGEDSPGHRLPRGWRITRGGEIRSLMQRGKRSRTAHLDVFFFTSPAPHPRAGVVVPKHRRTAVKRNRLKRQIREIVRTEVLPRLTCAQVHTDILVRARREAYDAAFGMLRDELVAWADRNLRWQSSSYT
ncbi:MAG: ribonuclease P protein component [Longimicrobiales bacterium]